MKDLNLVRKIFTDVSTIGELFIDGKHFCWTLEDIDRQRQKDGSIIPWNIGIKIPGETAIPYGTYEVITNYSNRFKKVMPLIKDVPGFTGVRLHSGNDVDSTEGCPVLGYIKNPNWVGQSKVAFIDFFELLTTALNNDERVFITISKEA